jgi:hypothetical protein
MEDQLTHQDEERHREQSEGRNGSESPCYDADKTWHPSEEEISRNHVDNEKGKSNGQVRKEEEDHPSKKQADDKPPLHGLTLCLDIDQPAPRHPEELDGQEEAPDGDDDENCRFRNSHCPHIRYPT